MNARIVEINDWLPKENYDTRREVILGLIKRISNFSLLEQTIRVLLSVLQKDFTYSRSQCFSSLINRQDTNLNKMLLLTDQDDKIEKIWSWFEFCSYTEQATFVFHVIKIINDYSILHQSCILARTILNATEENKPDYTEVDSGDIKFGDCSNTHFNITESHNSFNDIPLRSKSVLSMYSNFEIDFPEPKNPSVDFVGKLPVHLAKKILNMLGSLGCAMCVNRQWRNLVKQVLNELHTKQEILEEAIMMQGATSRDPDSIKIKTTNILIPILQSDLNTIEDADTVVCYKGAYYKQISVEERPIYIGPYNVLILDHASDSSRVMHYSGGDSIITSSTNRNIRLFDVTTGYETQPYRKSHSGSITSIYVTTDERKVILTGSYDTTIRSWHTGKIRCQKIMYGHNKSVTTLNVFGDNLASGGNDGLVKAWDFITGKCLATFVHTRRGVVTSVSLHENILVSSCNRGTIKVWNISTKKLVKCLRGHVGAVTSVTMDENFIISAGIDGYVITWFKKSHLKKYFKCYRHPKPVLCVQVRHLHIISGCEDGKIRILHLVSGECLRVLRGNSKCEPILSISATPQRLVVNTLSTLLLLQFEEWKPTNKQPVINTVEVDGGQAKAQIVTANTHSYVRACRRIRSAVSRASSHSLRPQTSHTSYTLF